MTVVFSAIDKSAHTTARHVYGDMCTGGGVNSGQMGKLM
jgi:hypothetical protein